MTTVELVTDGKMCYNEQNEISMETRMDPWKISYMILPNSRKKLNVLDRSTARCLYCKHNHNIVLFNLEQDYEAFFCENYLGGNWVFTKK